MGGGASSLHAVSISEVGLGETSRHKLSTTSPIPEVEGEACGKTMVASWGHDLPPFGGGEVRNPSLQQGHQDPHPSLGEGNRLGESQSSCPAFAWVQECELLRQEIKSLRECVSQLCSECRHNFRELRNSLGMAKLQTGEDNRVDFTQNKLEQQQLEQHKQEQTDEQDDELEKAHLDSQQKLAKEEAATKGELGQLTQKKKRKRNRKQKQQEVAWEETSYQEHQQELWCNNSLGTTSSVGTNSSIGTNSSLGTIPEEEPTTSFDQEKCMILVDTGAELSVAPWAFASQSELSPAPPDLQLRNADGRAIQIFGVKTLQLFCQGVSFTMSFVIASVDMPLLGFGSLLEANMCLQFDPQHGHQLVTTEGERMKLVQLGNQVYLPACYRQLPSSSSMIGALHSLMPEDELRNLADNLGEHKEVPKKGGVGEEEPSFTLELEHQQNKQENKPAIGQQQLALPKLRRTQAKRGQQQVDSKLRTWQQLRYKEKMQLALLDEPRVLEEEASKDLSLRIILLTSLMNKWQLATARIQPACQKQLKIGHLRELGLIQSNLCSEIFHGSQLCVFLDEIMHLDRGKEGSAGMLSP